MTIEQIETFLIITETNNISMAGKKLFISQSTVSHRLNSLEKELGFSLLTRTRGERFVNLTLKGEEFIEIAKRWKALWTETNLWKVQESKMNLKIASINSLNISVFSNFYKELIKEKNSLSIHISSHWSKTIYDLIENYDVDIGFVITPFKYPNIVVKPLFKARGVVISLEDSKYHKLIHPYDLKSSDEILFARIPEYAVWRNFWWEDGKKEYSSVDTVFLLFSILDSKEKWSIVPVWIARALAKIHPIKISELSVSPPEYSCYQVTNKHPRPSKLKALEVFFSTLENFLIEDIFLKTVK